MKVMNRNKNWLLAASLMLTLLGCASQGSRSVVTEDAPSKITSVPYYRFWRGMKLDELKQDAYMEKMSKTFVPAAPKTHAKNGLVSYTVAFPKKNHSAVIPDEIALIAYESKEVYDRAKATPEGQAYSDLHWTVFKKDASRSEVPVVFSDVNPETLESGKAYDMINKPIDWQSGYTVAFIGERKKSVAREDFLEELTKHVLNARDSFKDHGFDGYLVLGTEDYEIAFIHWESKKAADAVFSRELGKNVADEAARLMDINIWADANEFAGKAEWEKGYNVTFKRRK